ncbi:MAG TPA: hypothetical protein VM580_32390 [Labilithrix sp.]|nr:hypothetical protein [Labilithrix sp.]
MLAIFRARASLERRVLACSVAGLIALTASLVAACDDEAPSTAKTNDGADAGTTLTPDSSDASALPDAAPTASTFTGAVPKGPPLNFTAQSSNTELLSAVVGEHDVAIYAAPTIDDIGPAKLSVTFDGTTVGQKLTRADGTVITDIAVTLADESCGDGTCVVWIDDTEKRPFAPSGGKEVSIDDYYANPPGDASLKRRIKVAYFPDGHIRGYVGLSSQFLFRNDLLASGTAVPSLFGQLAASYTSTSEQNTCEPNPFAIDITASGTVRVRGKSSVSCAEQDVTVTWDGQDDIVEPTATGARLLLDSKNIGGAQPPGGIVMGLASPGATTFTALRVNFAGTQGDMTTRPDTVTKNP